MYTPHHSISKPYDQQRRDSKWDKLSLGCKLRGISLKKHSNKHFTMDTPEGLSLSFGSIREAYDSYLSDPALHGLPITNTNEQ